jgi:hypothetical protein
LARASVLKGGCMGNRTATATSRGSGMCLSAQTQCAQAHVSHLHIAQAMHYQPCEPAVIIHVT